MCGVAYLSALRVDEHQHLILVGLVRAHLPADLTAVEGKEDPLPRRQQETRCAAEARPHELVRGVLSAGPLATTSTHTTHGTLDTQVEAHRVARVGSQVDAVVVLGEGRRGLDGVYHARIVLAVLHGRHNASSDDGPLGQTLACRHICATNKHTRINFNNAGQQSKRNRLFKIQRLTTLGKSDQCLEGNFNSKFQRVCKHSRFHRHTFGERYNRGINPHFSRHVNRCFIIIISHWKKDIFTKQRLCNTTGTLKVSA